MSNEESVSSEVVVDTILTGNNFDEDGNLFEPDNDIYVRHERYLPKIDSIIALFNMLEE